MCANYLGWVQFIQARTALAYG